MKLKVELAGRAHDVSLNLVKDKASADLDARHYELEVLELADAQYLLINKSDVYRCRVEGNREASNFFEVVLRGHSYNIRVVDPKRLRSGQTSGPHDHGTAQILSPMPGKVVRVLVAEGQRVQAGAGIVVVEAMKMQNEMKAPKAGVVISINAQPDATVNAGDVLAIIE